jgi:hypothetical protein
MTMLEPAGDVGTTCAERGSAAETTIAHNTKDRSDETPRGQRNWIMKRREEGGSSILGGRGGGADDSGRKRL